MRRTSRFVRFVLVPVAALAILGVSALPASAASATPKSTVVTAPSKLLPVVKPNGMNF